MLLSYVDWLQVVTLTGILAVPFAPLMLIVHGASLQTKGIPASQVCPCYPHPCSPTVAFSVCLGNSLMSSWHFSRVAASLHSIYHAMMSVLLAIDTVPTAYALQVTVMLATLCHGNVTAYVSSICDITTLCRPLVTTSIEVACTIFACQAFKGKAAAVSM